MAPSLMGLKVTSGQHDVVLPPPLTLRLSGSVVGLATVPQQQPLFQMPLPANANYAIDPTEEGFCFRVEPFTIFYVFGVFWCMLCTFGCHADCCIYLLGLNHWCFHHCNPLEITHGRHVCNLATVISPHKVCTAVAAPSTALTRGSLLLLSELSSSHANYMVGYTGLGA